ncbi:unnamed protein product [Amoebophrya sp. A25]|nr:unnamed protein product [Amoebophrya sp. A25]|eukprot:GSA25T00027370001.1
MATSLVPTLRGRAKNPDQMGSAHLLAVLLAVGVFSGIILYGYHVFGNATPDLLTDGFRSNRDDAQEDPWFLRVYGYSESSAVRRAATLPQHCMGRRKEITSAHDLFTHNWPQSKEGKTSSSAPTPEAESSDRGRPIEWYSPWTMGDPTWGCSFVLNLLVALCLFTTDMLYTASFFSSSGVTSSTDESSHTSVKEETEGEHGEQDAQAKDARIKRSTSPAQWWPRVFRLYLWPVVVALGRLLCALLVPHIVEVVGLVSSMSLVVTEILLPLIGYYKVVGGGRPAFVRRIFHAFILIFGFLMFVLATYAGVVRLAQKIMADHGSTSASQENKGRPQPVCNGEEGLLHLES